MIEAHTGDDSLWKRDNSIIQPVSSCRFGQLQFSFETTLCVVEHQNETIILGTDCLKSAGVYLDPENNRLVRKAQQNRTTTEKDTMQQNLEGVQSLRARRRKADYHLG